MKSKTLFPGGVVILLLAGFAQAQNKKCEELRAVLQARLEIPAGWQGEAHGTVSEITTLNGTFQALVRPTSKVEAGISVEQGLVILWDFGSQGSLTTEIPYGLTLQPAPGPSGVAAYRGVGRIVAGTGQFEKTAGTILLEGTYVIWFAAPGDPTSVQGRWNADVRMRVCKEN